MNLEPGAPECDCDCIVCVLARLSERQRKLAETLRRRVIELETELRKLREGKRGPR